MEKIRLLIDSIQHSLSKNKDVLGIFLVGSHARKTAREDSDIDLVILVENPQVWPQKSDWFSGFGEIIEYRTENWGVLTSVRVFYKGGLEVEFGITKLSWANIYPIDLGTEKVIQNGAVVLYDPVGQCQKLIDFVQQKIS